MIQSFLSLLLASTLSIAPNALSLQAFDDSSLLSVSSIPILKEEATQPNAMSAVSIYSVDLDSQAPLFERNASAPVPIASITKLMTATLVLEDNDPEEIVVVSQRAAEIAGSQMFLQTGEKIKVKELIAGLLIESGNDAAIALAEHNAGTVEAFVDKMNERAEDLGLYSTLYTNPHGLDDGTARSSARDIAMIASHLVKDPTIRAIAGLETAQAIGEDGTVHELKNTNILLGTYGVKGLKTGKTEAAGECLVALVEQNGHEIITVVLGSGNRFSDTRSLIDWIYQAYVW